MRLTTRLIAAGIVALVPACTLLLDATSDGGQCKVTSECAARGSGLACVNGLCVRANGGDAGAGDGSAQGSDAADASANDAGPWDCLGNVHWSPQENETTIQWTNKFLYLTSRAAVPNLPVRACGGFDTTCATPLQGATTGADGLVTIGVPKFFSGYLEISAPAPDAGADAAPGATPYPSIVYPIPNQGASFDTSTTVPALVVAPAELGGIAQALSASVAPGFGHVFGATFDCALGRAAGIVIRADTVAPGKTFTYYIGSNLLPSATQTETSVRGSAGFVNLPPGFVTISYSLAATGQTVGRATVLVRPDTVTLAMLTPSPASGGP